MNTLKMIIKSYKKQKTKSMLIFIQLFISSFCLSLGIGFFEINISHISEIKSIINTDIIYTLINMDTSFQNLSENQKSNIGKFYNDIKNDERVMSIGTYDVGYVTNGNDSNRPNNMYDEVPVIIMDNSFFNILKDEEKVKIFNEKNNDELRMAIGSAISHSIKIGEKVNIYSHSLYRNYEFIADSTVDNKTSFLSKSISGNVTNDLISTEYSIFVLLPESEDIIYNYKYFIKLNENVDSVKFIEDIDNLGKQYGLENHTHSIDDEIQSYTQINRIPMLASLSLSIILLILSSIGLVGVILSSILQRKKEFGIRYSLGCTPDGLIKLIVGEIMILFIISILLGLICSFIVSIFIDNMEIGLLTIGSSSGIMFVFCLMSSIIPAKRISKMDPITLINRGCD